MVDRELADMYFQCEILELRLSMLIAREVTSLMIDNYEALSKMVVDVRKDVGHIHSLLLERVVDAE